MKPYSQLIRPQVKEVTEEDRQKAEDKALLEQQHKWWVEHQQTEEFLSFLESTRLQLLEMSESLATVDPKDDKIARNLIKAKTIKEMIEYARRTTRRED